MGRGPYVGDVEGGDVSRMLEDGAQLAREPLDLLVGEVETRQSGDVSDVVTGDGSGHRMSVVVVLSLFAWPSSATNNP